MSKQGNAYEIDGIHGVGPYPGVEPVRVVAVGEQVSIEQGLERVEMSRWQAERLLRVLHRELLGTDERVGG